MRFRVKDFFPNVSSNPKKQSSLKNDRSVVVEVGVVITMLIIALGADFVSRIDSKNFND